MSASLRLTSGVSTDVGRVRDHNEDSALAAGTLFVVADGMGGHAAGEVASELAVHTVGRLETDGQRRLRDVLARVDEANRRILTAAAHNPRQSGMGTTLAGLAVVEVSGCDHWAVFNIGDSRVYRLSPQGQLQQVTVDHSQVRELVDAGWITEAQARTHPSRNVVTRSLGRDPMGSVDSWVFPQQPGERFVLCSDGLSNELDDEEILEVLSGEPDPQVAADTLVARALDHGGRDNVTAVVVHLDSGADAGVDAGEGAAGAAGTDGRGASDADENTYPRAVIDRMADRPLA